MNVAAAAATAAVAATLVLSQSKLTKAREASGGSLSRAPGSYRAGRVALELSRAMTTVIIEFRARDRAT